MRKLFLVALLLASCTGSRGLLYEGEGYTFYYPKTLVQGDATVDGGVAGFDSKENIEALEDTTGGFDYHPPIQLIDNSNGEIKDFGPVATQAIQLIGDFEVRVVTRDWEEDTTSPFGAYPLCVVQYHFAQYAFCMDGDFEEEVVSMIESFKVEYI